MALQKENLKDELRLRLFDQLTDKIAAADTALLGVSLWGYFVPSALSAYLQQSNIHGFQPAPVKYRTIEFLERQQKADRAVIAVISAIEHREVIDPAFLIFRYAISDQSEKCRSAFNAFHLAILPVLPVDPPAGLAATGAQPRSPRQPSEEDIPSLEELGRALHREYLTLSNYLNDLSREAQNRLLGRIFAHQVHPRRPLDQSVLVIGTRKEELEAVEERLELAKHIHPDVLPSKILYPRSFSTRRWIWRRPERGSSRASDD